MNYNEQAQQAQIADSIARQVREQIARDTAGFAGQIELQREQALSDMKQAVDGTARRIGDQVEQVTRQAVESLNRQATQSGNMVRQQVEKAGASVGEQIAEQIDGLMGGLSKQIAEAREHAELLAAERAALAEAEAKAEAKIAEARKAEESARAEKESAEKAVAMLHTLSEIEVEKYTADAEFKRRTALLKRELEVEQARRTDDQDRRVAAIQSGLLTYHPKLMEQLDKIVAEGEADIEEIEKNAAETIKAISEKSIHNQTTGE